jgi:hypothetical protein
VYLKRSDRGAASVNWLTQCNYKVSCTCYGIRMLVNRGSMGVCEGEVNRSSEGEKSRDCDPTFTLSEQAHIALFAYMGKCAVRDMAKG